MAVLHKIFVYPIKGFDGIEVRQASITAGGKLKYDRQFAFVNSDGKFVNGKRYPEILKVRVSFNLNNLTCAFNFPGKDVDEVFNLRDDKAAIERMFGKYLNIELRLVENDSSGFPDDTEAGGPTIAALESFAEVSAWLPNLTVEELIRRFRINLVLAGVPPFWEDKLYGKVNERRPFTIGTLRLDGTGPCARCSVPSRDSRTAESNQRFRELFMQNRERTLPTWAEKSRFDHYFRMCVNTVILATEESKSIFVGDKLLI
jgi:uncharacterized protein YcbX